MWHSETELVSQKMVDQIPSAIATKFDRMTVAFDTFDWDWMEETLDRYPTVAKRMLPDGRLPLRVLLEAKPPECFSVFHNYGAEHDLITEAAAAQPDILRQLLTEDSSQVHVFDNERNTPISGNQREPADPVG